MKIPVYQAIGGMAPRFAAGFDSTSAMLMSLGNFLNGKDFPGVGIAPSSEMLARGINSLSRQARETAYVWSGFFEAVPPDKIDKIRSEELSRWVINVYPKRPYPGVMIGSSSGAMVHLATALGLPWLPQTFLIPVRRPPEMHVDEPRPTMEWAKEPGKVLLQNNPDLQLHHMFDPNQDRLMLERMTYFRVKRLRLGNTYERFIRQSLTEGGTIFLVECQRRWPTTKVDNRHIFQFGALGGATPEEFLHGSERVKDYLKDYNSPFEKWDSPEPDKDRPEAEWGFEAALREDVEKLAEECGYSIKRIIFEEPEHLSPLVADLYRWWYRQRRIIANRLLVEFFIAHDPYWTLRTGSAPFWMKFNMDPSAEWLETYLENVDPYDEIYIILFSHGVDAIGLAPIERWQTILQKARKKGDFIGVDQERFPRDFGVFARYNKEIQEKIPARYPLPGPLTLDQLKAFLDQNSAKYPVEWVNF